MPKNNQFGGIIYNIKNKIEGMKALQAPYNLALIRHGSNLAEKLIAELPPRNKKDENAKNQIQNKPLNILKNPSFEEVENGIPKDWVAKVHYGKASLNSDSSIARTGRYSGRIKSKMGGGAELHIVPYLEAGEYILSGWVKTEGVEGNNGCLLYTSPSPRDS